MKKLLIPALVLLSCLFLVSIVVSALLLVGVDGIWSVSSVRESKGKVVAVLLPSERDLFWDDLSQSLVAQGRRDGIVFEVSRYSLTSTNASEVVEKFSLGKFDGFVCYPPDNQDISQIIDRAEQRGLPVFLLENDYPKSRRQVYLGTSSFQMGSALGGFLKFSAGLPFKVGVVLSQSEQDRQTVRNSLFMSGLNEVLGPRRGSVSFEEVFSPPGRFAGEDLVWGLLREDEPVQALITTTTKDTLSALQTIVDANRVGRTSLVGFGEDPTLRAALAQGILAGVLTRDPGEWARLIGDTVRDLFAGQTVSSYVTLPLTSVAGNSLGR